MVSVCTVPARGGMSCEHFGGYKTINRIPLPFISHTPQLSWDLSITYFSIIEICLKYDFRFYQNTRILILQFAV